MTRELEQYIADGARKITPAHLEKLIRWLPEIRLAATQVTQYPQFTDQVGFLAEIIEDFHSGLNPSIPYTAIAEAAFALLYFRKGVDIVPDMIAGIGYADDVAIVTSVFEHYREPFLRHVLSRK